MSIFSILKFIWRDDIYLYAAPRIIVSSILTSIILKQLLFDLPQDLANPTLNK